MALLNDRLSQLFRRSRGFFKIESDFEDQETFSDVGAFKISKPNFYFFWGAFQNKDQDQDQDFADPFLSRSRKTPLSKNQGTSSDKINPTPPQTLKTNPTNTITLN